MFRTAKIVRWIEANPHQTNEIILGIAILIYGVYIVGPWYTGGPNTPVNIALESTLAQTLTGLLYATSGVTAIYGAAKSSKRFRYWGTLLVFSSFIFMTILRLLAVGWSPIVWVAFLACAILAGVSHIRISNGRDDA